MEESDWLMEKIFMVVERFQFHKEKAGEDNPMISEFAKKMCEIEMYEMWLLTQTNR